jgi:hypothetical protein
MTRFFVTFVLLTVLACIAMPQDIESKCPKFNLRGPNGDEKPVVYTVVWESKDDAFRPVYEWSVFNGKILSGIGTDKIFVEREEDRALTVRIKILGVPESCVSEMSESSIIDRPPVAIKQGEFSGALNKMRADNFDAIIRTINNNPNAILLLVISGSKRNTSLSIRKKQNFLQNVVFNKLKGRIRFVVRETIDDRTDIWLVPAGSEYLSIPGE